MKKLSVLMCITTVLFISCTNESDFYGESSKLQSAKYENSKTMSCDRTISNYFEHEEVIIGFEINMVDFLVNGNRIKTVDVTKSGVKEGFELKSYLAYNETLSVKGTEYYDIFIPNNVDEIILQVEDIMCNYDSNKNKLSVEIYNSRNVLIGSTAINTSGFWVYNNGGEFLPISVKLTSSLTEFENLRFDIKLEAI